MFTLQRQLFSADDERLLAVVNVTKVNTKTRKDKKQSMLCLTVKRNNVALYKVKLANNTYNKRRSWPLEELKSVDGMTGAEFILHFEKPYRWGAVKLVEKNSFLFSLWKLCNKYLDSAPPFVNVNLADNVPADDVASVPGSPTSYDDEGPATDDMQDYKELTADEERDTTELLKSCDWAFGDAEAFTASLADELGAIEAANIHSILESEAHVEELMELLDTALMAVEDLDAKVAVYEDMLQTVRKDVSRVSEQESSVRIQTENYKSLLEEMELLVTSIELPSYMIEDLQSGDLTSPIGVQSCITAATKLQEKIEIHSKPGLSAMAVVVTQAQVCKNLQDVFANRLVKHVQQLLAEQVESRPVKRITALTLPDHVDRHNELLVFGPLMEWLHVVDPESSFSRYSSVCQLYGTRFAPVYKREISALFDNFKTTVSGAKNKDANSRRMFTEAFSRVVSTLVPTILEEQEFIVNCFQLGGELTTSGSQENVSNEASPGESDGTPVLSRKKENAGIKAIDIMEKLFPDVIEGLLGCLEIGDKLDSFHSVTMLMRLQDHVLVSAPMSSFLKKVLGQCLVTAKRQFDGYINAHIAQIQATKIKPKPGIYWFVADFAEFIKQMEAAIEGVERRIVVDKAYINVVDAVFATTKTLAQEAKYTDLVMLENFHRLYDQMSQLKIEVLKGHRPVAQTNYRNHLDSYVESVLGSHAMGKLSNFFNGVETLMASGVAAHEVGFRMEFSKQELRKCIKDFPPKEVKKHLEGLYKRVQRHLTTEESLLVVVWRSIQEAFVTTHKRFETLIEQCYPGSQMKLEFTVEDLLQFFSSIAR